MTRKAPPPGSTEAVAEAPPYTFAGRRVLVVGLGRFGGGVGVTRWLASQGANVTVTDSADPTTLGESLQSISDLKVSLRLGGHDGIDPSDFHLAVINPAVHKPTSGLFAKILRANLPWTTEINFFCERCPAPVIAVTGSFGKSTTCAMMAAVLDRHRKSAESGNSGVFIGGNIGRSLLNELGNIRPSDVVVLELSNSQLEDMPLIDWSPKWVLVTNLQPQHLERHGTFRAYVEAKMNLVRAGGGNFPVMLGPVHPEATRWVAEAVADRPGPVIPVASPERPLELAVPGRHNRNNAACVWTVCREMGIRGETVRAALREFRGLPHRLEFVGTVDGVRYVNDSKSTAPAATIMAIEALTESVGNAWRDTTTDSGSERFHRRDLAQHEEDGEQEKVSSGRTLPGLIIIVGGQKKEVALGECARAIVDHCRMAICYGEAGPAFAGAIRDASGGSDTDGAQDAAPTEVVEVPDVASAVGVAQRNARPGETVLFSPGAPSFDQYVNFTERGRHFAGLVGARPPE